MIRFPRMPGCWEALGRRLAEAALVLGLAVVLAFAMARLMPGDPATVMMDGQGTDPALVRRLWGAGELDLPLWRQFVDYLTGLPGGDFGLSWRYAGMPVTTLIGEAAPVTLLLVVATLTVAVLAGIAAGIASAHRPGTWLDGALTVGAVLALSMPPVVLATWLMLATPGRLVVSLAGDWLGDLAGLMAPVAALAIAPIGIVARSTRAQLLEVLGHDYVRCARAKGLSALRVMIGHALPNAMVGVWAVVGTLAGAILTSTAVVETVFNLPGLGRLAIEAVLARDYPVAGAVVLVFVLVQVTISLAVDLLIVAIAPTDRDTLDQP